MKRIFLHRLTSHYFFNDVKYGFIVETLTIITDLGLEGCIVNFLNTGVFPGKYVWKKQVRSKLETMTSANVLTELHLENIDRFLSFNSALKPSRFWYLCRRKPHLLAACKSVVKAISLLFNRYSRSVCSACGAEVDSYVNHRVLWCPVYQTVRQKFWYLIWHKCEDDSYLKLASAGDEVTLNIMLGDYGSMADSANSSTEEDFYCLVTNYIQRLNL